jgi:CRP/FNR family transcriptional regulator, cyclic AMP receptor protein
MRTSETESEILSQRIAFLENVAPFAGLRRSELSIVAEKLKPKKYKKKEIIFHQEDDSRSAFIIMKGTLRVVRINQGGNETTINVYSQCDIIGEFSAIDEQPRSCMIQAVEDCILLQIDRKELLHLIREMPDFAIGFIKLIIQKLRWTTSFAETIAQYNTPGRLLLILLHFKDKLGREIIRNKQYEIDLYMNQTDLASLVGARREWVNRILKDWSQKGLIKHEKGIITLLDLPAVETELARSKDIFSIDGMM